MSTKPYYEDGTVTIYHGDCFELLPVLTPSADAVVTDPPFVYSAAVTGNYLTKGEPGHTWSDADVMGRWFACALDVMRSSVVGHWGLLSFCSMTSYPIFFPHCYRRFDNVIALVWDKGRIGTGNRWRRTYELILYAYNPDAYWDDRIHDRSDVLRFAPTPQRQRGHPVDKPVGLLAHIIEPTVPDSGIVLDPFMGGGSTLLAAKRLGRRAVGIEAEERYCEVAAKRCQQQVLNLQSQDEWGKTADNVGYQP